jgi:two-component system nitrate/nitrite response regulator NarL
VAKSVVSTALSQREKEIARLAGSGLSNCEVSQRLSLSQYTVKNDLVRVYEKLGISTHIELIFYITEQQQNSESKEADAA